MFPVQILVTKKLSKEENFWLRSMTNDLTKEDATELIQRYEGHEHNNQYQSVMNVIVQANKTGFEEMKQMCDALLELMKDELEEMKAQGWSQGLSQGKQEQLLMQIEKKLLKGKTVEQIADELEETVEVITPLYSKICSSKMAQTSK